MHSNQKMRNKNEHVILLFATIQDPVRIIYLLLCFSSNIALLLKKVLHPSIVAKHQLHLVLIVSSSQQANWGLTTEYEVEWS